MAIGLNQTTTQMTVKTPDRSKKSRSGADRFYLRIGRQVTQKELLFFSSQLSLMLEIGTPMNSALKAIANQTENPVFKSVILEMLQSVEDGRQLSDAMKQRPRIFSNVFSSMIKAGETVGLLKEIIDRLVEMEEKRQALKAQIKSALTYPIVLCAVATVVVIFVLVVVLPKFTAFFAGKESVLPWSTQFLMLLSGSIRAYWWAYLSSSVGMAMGIYFFLRSGTGSALIDRLIVSAPLVGTLSNKIYNCQLLRILGNLMESHVPMIEALEVTRDTIGNVFFRNFIDKIVGHVREGGRFSQPFADYPYTLASVKQMVSTGEEAGNLSRVMLRLADFYDKEVDRELKGFAAMIEPIALVVIGGVVGLIVSSVILPMFRLAQVVR